MATLTSGVGYALYWTAKRYIVPLIAPPTPPQLEADKASIDASFDKTFALLEQLSQDTKELKDAEAARKERLDRALGEVESVIGKMKEANENRESEAKRWAREVEEIKEQIPLAIQREKESMDGRLRDLAGEMKSLKTLVGNRMGSGPAAQRPNFTTQATPVDGVNGVHGAEEGEKQPPPQSQPQASSVLPERPSSASPYGSRILGGKAQIPSWQLAAKKRSEEAKKEEPVINGGAVQDVSESGTVAPAEVETSA
jgi:peroxin-14